MSCTTEIVLREPAVKSGSGKKSRPGAGVLVIRSVFRAVRRWNLRRRTMRELSWLDDRALKDIGIGRSEIGYVAREVSRDFK
jgi:uncharacterized protein YjiS (DUF1127 family)